MKASVAMRIPETKRYQFDVPAEEVGHIDQMKAVIGAGSNGELFDNALTLLDWAITQVKAGRKLASIADDGSTYRELVMPALEKARTRSYAQAAQAAG